MCSTLLEHKVGTAVLQKALQSLQIEACSTIPVIRDRGRGVLVCGDACTGTTHVCTGAVAVTLAPCRLRRDACDTCAVPPAP